MRLHEEIGHQFGASAGGDERVLLISGLGRETGGGIYAFNGSNLERLDPLATRGMALAGEQLIRLLDGPGTGSDLLICDGSGAQTYARLDCVSDGHDICWHEDRLAIVSTGSNQIVWTSPDGELERVWQAPGSGDAWHLNCLLPLGERLLVCAFGRFRAHRAWVGDERMGAGLLHDVDKGEDVVTGLSCPHHPRLVDGLWVVCNSATGELVGFDARTRSLRRSIDLGGWTRGIAVCDDVILVGVSGPRHVPDHPAPGLARIVAVDRNSWQVVWEVEVPCQEVYDLVLAPARLADALRTGSPLADPVGAHGPNRNGNSLQDGLTSQWRVPSASCRVDIVARLPFRIAPGDQTTISCRVVNLGDRTLATTGPYPVSLSYRWLSQDADGGLDAEVPVRRVDGALRTPLSSPLFPGGVGRQDVMVVAPALPGDYDLCITLVQEHLAWFDDLHPDNAVRGAVRVESSAVRELTGG